MAGKVAGARSLRQSGPQRRRAAGLVEAAWAKRHDPRARAQVALALLLAAALAAFAHIVEDYLTGDPIVRWDVEFASWLHANSSAGLVSLFKVVTILGNVGFLLVLTLAAVIVLLRRRAVNEAALVCVVALGVELLNGGLKLAFHRPRPELTYVHLDTYSFPSGHAAGATAIYGIVLLLAARGRTIRWQGVCLTGFVVLVVAIGFSRLYLEAHYLSDVLAGISLGFAWLAASLFVFETYRGPSIQPLLGRRVGRLLNQIGRPAN